MDRVDAARRRFLLGAALGTAVGVLVGVVGTVLVVDRSPDAGTPAEDAAAPLREVSATDPDLGPGVVVLSPSMSVAEIHALVDGITARQTDDEMGTGRYAVLLEPGTYGTDTEPLQLTVGYYTEVAGLGASPGDVVVNGKIEVFNRCLADDGTSNCLALVNFWRTLANLTIDADGAGQDGCRQAASTWAVSQAVSMRRVDVLGGDGRPPLSLTDTCSAGPQYGSGGFVADSRAGDVVNGSQQQWFTRNSVIGSWSNAVWNQVFAGVEGAPDDSAYPDPAYTTLERTPLSREKPYLFVDGDGAYQVRVPAAQRDSSGISWADGPTPGRTVPLTDFFVARPKDPVATINEALEQGRHLLLTPGVYDVGESIAVERPDTVVLGIGHPTLTAVDGATPLTVADVPGVVVAGVTVDAGEVRSPVLVRVGSGAEDAERAGDPANPTTLSDVYLRVGGPHPGSADVALEVNGDHVLVDHAWVWRADHGAEGFDDGERWVTNIGRQGVVVHGDHVTATGLFVEHFQEHNTFWDGEDGTTVFYQSELAYDPPDQAAWMKGDVEGWAGYAVGADVRRHVLHGGGVYAANLEDPSIRTANGFEVPQTPGVRLHHVATVSLGAGTIEHVVNGVGEAADPSRTGRPVYVESYPGTDGDP